MMTQPRTVEADGKITCPDCGAKWYDCTSPDLENANTERLRNADIETLALWPDGRVTLVGSRDHGYTPIRIKELLAGIGK